MDKLRTIALYGGAFDPPHKSHLSIIQQILNIPFIKEVWLLPCGDRNDKRLVLSKQDRFDLLKKLTDDCCEKVTVSDEEIKLSQQFQRMIPTAELISMFKEKHKGCQFHFVVGGDILSTINTWEEHEKLMKEVNFIIFPRRGFDLNESILPTNYYLSSYIPDQISSSWVKSTLLDDSISKEEKKEKVKPFLENLTLKMLTEKGYL